MDESEYTNMFSSTGRFKYESIYETLAERFKFHSAISLYTRPRIRSRASWRVSLWGGGVQFY